MDREETPEDCALDAALDIARDSVVRYFGKVAGRSKRVRDGYRFSVTAGDKDKVCSVTVVGDGDRVSLLFSPKPAWGHSRFARLVTDRMGSDLDPVPELAYGANQGRFGVHVPIALPRADLQMAIHCICSMYDASGPAACQTPVRSEHLICTRCI